MLIKMGFPSTESLDSLSMIYQSWTNQHPNRFLDSCFLNGLSVLECLSCAFIKIERAFSCDKAVIIYWHMQSLWIHFENTIFSFDPKSLNTYLIIYLNNQIILFSTVLSILNSRNQDKFFRFVSLIFFLLLIVIRMIFLYIDL